MEEISLEEAQAIEELRDVAFWNTTYQLASKERERAEEIIHRLVLRLTPRALDGAYCSCENPDIYINRVCQLCGLPHTPRQ